MRHKAAKELITLKLLIMPTAYVMCSVKKFYQKRTANVGQV